MSNGILLTIETLRGWFFAHGFQEVRTAEILRAPAPEDYIDAVRVSSGGWHRTSPELQMKRLLAAGAGPIFQIGPCWRAEEEGPFHRERFTMLEWYRPHAGSGEILEDTKGLLAHCVAARFGEPSFWWGGRRISAAPEAWEILQIRDAFRVFAGWDPVAAFDADRFDVDLVDKVEPALAKDHPVVLAGYPAALAALARRDPLDSRTADRWEAYLGGIELANAYGELTDAAEQRRRFEASNRFRAARGAETYPLDEEFLMDLRRMPPSGGIALGVDRLHMLLSGAPTL